MKKINYMNVIIHRKVDKVAIVAPAVICIGRGPDKKNSFPLFELFFKHKKVVGKGDNIWYNIHVQDLNKLYLLLAESIVNGDLRATWNEEKWYYLTEYWFLCESRNAADGCQGLIQERLYSAARCRIHDCRGKRKEATRLGTQHAKL
ncbi:hypothetical protein SPOG_03192 [Schizosaccharomyces cryophilus OY26]|uniref:Uncharacterized protein n=1 Tax=Schizosaccharomyces cryophilus (strain OY26 / ATCC MYA-4695 / CBS 11777 / NBRC 106824 / NRRL Y48691) TaxID=653667 RepID=S9W6R8_SCHCR|nr:uncharacterized protein SPOG_03192 [Schizosaccharomyces cryophilus OY26]EPY53570.1 hypothetical protein SPOG_03192 [Schizosaccharomyces cryophilus OY26]